MADQRVSVVIPVFGRQTELDHALASLVSEEGHILDIIVIDDASPAPTVVNAPEVLRDRVRLVRLDANIGSSAARQVAVDHAKGEFIAFLDSDDVWLPGKLEAQLAFFEGENPLLAVATSWQVVSLNEGKTWCRTPLATADVADFASSCWFCPGSTVILHRKAFDLCGPFDPSLRRLEDLDWFLRFALLGGRLEVANVCGAMIRRTKGRNKLVVDAAADHVEAKFRPILGETSQSFRNLMAWLDIERALAAFSANNYMLTVSYVLRSLLRKPRLGLHIKQWWRTGKPLYPLKTASAMLGADKTSPARQQEPSS
ncbi:MAG: glycosyltransferase family 2 protein [Beijerinckiaceae bacterium]